jgi:hypothetical protein
MLSVEHIFGAEHDVWSVNVDEAYHEEAAATASTATGTTEGAGTRS